jgi:L-gulonolactone oxidase
LQEIRFAQADEYALSPCYKQNSLWLGAYNADDFGWNELVDDFEQLAKKYNGRPHWGKETRHVNSDYLRSVYPLFGNFISLRNRFDPTGKFVNEYISKFFID